LAGYCTPACSSFPPWQRWPSQASSCGASSPDDDRRAGPGPPGDTGGAGGPAGPGGGSHPVPGQFPQHRRCAGSAAGRGGRRRDRYRLAGVLAALSAAVWFDFFLTQPYERFTITRRTDIETTVLLLAIGVAVTEIAVWGRRQHAAASRRAGYLDGINAAAKAVATGDSPAALIEQVSAQLTELLSLRSCRFQYGIAGIGRPARLQRDGRVTAGSRPSGFPYEDLPHGIDTELLVETGGLLQGRFLMAPGPETHSTLEQR
jgi:hypothetical protein